MNVYLLIGLMWFTRLGATAQPVDRFRRVEAADDFFRLQPPRLKPLILAHRGGPGPMDTENTIETFEKTVRALPDAIIEMDVRMTRDSGLVLLHDTTLDRESDATGPVASRTIAELQSVRLRTLNGTLTRQHIPTFADVLRWNKNRYMLALDVKPGTDPVWVMRLVHTFQAEHSVFVICYSMADARRMRSQYPDVWLAVGVNSETDLDNMEQNPLTSGRLVALTPQRLQPPSFYTRLHKLGMPVSTGTYGAGQLDEKKLPEAAAEYRNMATVGVDIITTDRPVAVAGLF